MRVAAAALALIAVVGTADAAPKKAKAPRGTFAAFIDPTLAHGGRPKPKPLSILFVFDCSERTGATGWLAEVRRRLARELGPKVIDPIVMRVVIDCRSGNDIDEGKHDCDASDETIAPVANANEMAIDVRCSSPGDIAAAIRTRIARLR